MKTINFQYNGKLLSDFNFVVCDFSSNSGISDEEAGSKISFTTVAMQYGKRYSLVGTKYDTCMTATFDICKNPEIFGDDLEITPDEFQEIMRWLNRREYLEFCFIPDNYDYYNPNPDELTYHYASFNLTKLMLDEKMFGIRLDLETNAPFGYGAEKTFEWTAESGNLSHTIADPSDEIGYIYPDITVTCNSAGDLTISNTLNGCSSVVKNCSAGEVITMFGNTNTIQTSLASHDISDDFNYDFFRIGNTWDSRDNVITVSSPCAVSLKYRPVRKFSYL